MTMAAAFRQMIEAGLSMEHALIAMEAMEQHAPRFATAAPAPEMTKRQARNARYYDGQLQRLKASESDGIKTIKTVSDAVKTPLPPDGPSLPPAPPSHPLNPPTPRPGAVGEADTPVAPVETPKPDPIAKPARLDIPSLFARFFCAYPGRGKAANPRKPAFEKFEKLVKAGIDPDLIIGGAERYDAAIRAAGKAGTETVAQAITFLNQHRWQDYPPPAAVADSKTPEHDAAGMPHIMAGSEEWDAWREHRGKAWPIDAKGGWSPPSRWPPGWPKSKTAEPKAPPSDVFAFEEDSS